MLKYPYSVEHLKNDIITIYHGSDNTANAVIAAFFHKKCDHEIKEPLFGKGSPDSDYGMGFYTTELQDKANQWALEMGDENAVTNEYTIDLKGLNVINLDDYGPMAWIAEIAYHRGSKSELGKLAAEIIVDMYKVDTSQADVIIGYRADSIYMQILDAFLEGKLTINETISLFKKGELGEQVCLVSEKAFEKIRFTNSYKCEKIDMQAPIRQAKKEAMKFLNRREEELAHGIKLQGMNVDDITANNFVYNQNTNQYEIETKENDEI